MRSIIDILLDDSDASIALSLCIAGDVARSTDATSESSGELTTASTRLPTPPPRGSKSFAQGTAAAGGVALPPGGGGTRAAGGGVARTGDRGGDLRSISGASTGGTTSGDDG